MSLFERRIERLIRLAPEQVSTSNTTRTPPLAPRHFLSLVLLLLWRVVKICSVVRLFYFVVTVFDERSEQVTAFIEGYIREKKQYGTPKHPTCIFIQRKRQDVCEGLSKEMNRPVAGSAKRKWKTCHQLSDGRKWKMKGISGIGKGEYLKYLCTLVMHISLS